MKPLLFLSLMPFTQLHAGTPDLLLGAQAYRAPKVDQAVEGGPLRIGGRTYAKGIGSHAVSEIPVTVPEGALRFTGAAGVDDGQGPGKGAVRFRILTGEQVLWESPVMKSGDPALRFDVPVPSTLHRRIHLQADDLGEDFYDHADWVDLGFTRGQAAAPEPARVLEGAEFGLKPGVKEDQSAAMRRAITALRAAPGSTLRLAKGEYHFHREGAIARHFHISNHDQPKWHPVSIPLVDLRGATLDGNGSLFVFHGEVLPLLVMDSEEITLKGIAIDCEIPHHAQGLLTRVEADAYEVEVDRAKHPHVIRDGWFVFTGEGWEARDGGSGILFDGRTRAIVPGTADFNYKGRLTELAPGRYRVEKNLATAGLKPGDVITFRLGWRRPHPAVTLYRARNTTLRDCPIHSSHGMGLLAQRSENIRISGGGVHPRKETGRFFSTTADATHFSNCKGLILSENGLYEGMMDDAINVHATCLRIEEKVDARTLRCRYAHPQSIGFETFLPGEKLRFIRAKWLAPEDVRGVTEVIRNSPGEILLRLDADIPDDLGAGDAVENADWHPEVVFRGNTVRHNRARGSLFTTPRPVRIEGNVFEAIAGSAILLAGDANGWYESGACGDVWIRHNTFRDNLTSRFQFTEAILSIFPEVPDLKGQPAPYHRNVRIEDNRFVTFDVPLVFAISTGGLRFVRNEVEYHDRFPSWKRPPFILKRCSDVVITDNRASRAGQPLRWTEKDVLTELSPAPEIR